MWKKLITTTLAITMLFSGSAIAKTRIVNLTGQNTLIFEGSVTEVSVNTFMRALIGIRNGLDPNEKLYVIIASPGGEYEAGKKILDFMDIVPNTELICRYCASAAGMMFIASKHKRLVNINSNILMHEMYLPKLTALNAMNKYILDDLISSSEDFNKMHYSRIGMTREAYMKKIRNTVWNVWGTEAIKLHLADEEVKIVCDDYVRRLAPKTCNPNKDNTEAE